MTIIFEAPNVAGKYTAKQIRPGVYEFHTAYLAEDENGNPETFNGKRMYTVDCSLLPVTMHMIP